MLTTEQAGAVLHGPAGHAPAPGWFEARKLSFECASPLPPVYLPLGGATGRVLARDVTALQDIPHFASSAMDGWAVNGDGPWFLPSTEQLTLPQPLLPNHARVIATGGQVPAGADAVLRKESGLETRDQAGHPVLVLHPGARLGEPRSGQHIRPAGAEALAGDVLLPAGTLLNPARIALAAGAGHDAVEVLAKPAVAVVLTGSEVVTHGIPVPGRVRDAFGPQLGTVISMLGGAPGSPLRIGDSFSEWRSALDGESTSARGRADVVITTGGTGKSGTDHFRAAIDSLGGHLVLDGIAMRPGHPAVLARLKDGQFVIGLPGNPLAAIMALLTIGAPLLAALGGTELRAPRSVLSGGDIEPDPGRTRLIPCRFLSGLAFPVHHVGPGMMRGLAWAEGVMVVPPAGAESGEPIPVIPLPWTTTTDTPEYSNNRGRNIPWLA